MALTILIKTPLQMLFVDVTAVVFLVLITLLPVLMPGDTFCLTAGIALSLVAFLILGILWLVVKQQTLSSLLALASMSSLSCMLLYCTTSAKAGDMAFLMQSIVFTVSAVAAPIPPL